MKKTFCITCVSALCAQECMNGGECTAPNRCNCTEQWDGEDCTATGLCILLCT